MLTILYGTSLKAPEKKWNISRILKHLKHLYLQPYSTVNYIETLNILNKRLPTAL